MNNLYNVFCSLVVEYNLSPVNTPKANAVLRNSRFGECVSVMYVATDRDSRLLLVGRNLEYQFGLEHEEPVYKTTQNGVSVILYDVCDKSEDETNVYEIIDALL